MGGGAEVVGGASVVVVTTAVLAMLLIADCTVVATMTTVAALAGTGVTVVTVARLVCNGVVVVATVTERRGVALSTVPDVVCSTRGICGSTVTLGGAARHIAESFWLFLMSRPFSV